jgi:spore maturation protein CgeB
VELQLPVVISGPRWRKFLPPEFVARYVSHDYLADSGYREAIWQSRVNLGFVTQLNEEDIGHKSMEIAACQGFLLTLRTAGHQAAFDEDREAVFFSSVEECAEKCRFYLDRPALREGIAQRGRDRAVQSGYDNDTQLAKVLRRLDGRDQGADSEG